MHPVIAAIPARYASTRLPGKPLLEIGGVPLIERVYRQVESAFGISEAIVLTDDTRIRDAVAGFGGRVEMTPKDLASGTDRIAWAARGWEADVILNVQGDEPLISPDALTMLAEHLVGTPEESFATLAAPIEPEVLNDPNVVKVVTDAKGSALYFSRAPIPFDRSGNAATALRHIGVYGYRRSALLEIAGTPQTPLELAESLEQLRVLESGFSMQVLTVPSAWPGVDTISDLREVEAHLAQHGDPLAR